MFCILFESRSALRNSAVTWSHGCAEGSGPNLPLGLVCEGDLTTQLLHLVLCLYLELRGGTEARIVLGLQRACVFWLAPVTLTFPRKTCVYDAKPISELPRFGGTCGTTLQVLLSTTHPTPPVAAGKTERKTSSYFENTRNPESSFLRHLNEKRKNQDYPNPIIWKQGLASSSTNGDLL